MIETNKYVIIFNDGKFENGEAMPVEKLCEAATFDTVEEAQKHAEMLYDVKEIRKYGDVLRRGY